MPDREFDRGMRMSDATSIPKWMREEEVYAPTRGRDGFLVKSILRLMSVLAKMRTGGSTGDMGAGAPVKVFYTLYLIVLIACSRNWFFSLTILAGLLVRLCFLPRRALTRCFFTTFFAALFSLFLMAPAYFLGSPRAMLNISGKVFVSVGLIQLLSATTSWNRITESLRSFCVPDLFVFTLDITLKYIVLLGDICLGMLEALGLRSVGKSRSKARSFAGVPGVAFLKSKEMGEEMYGAMVCRGFEGAYRRTHRFCFSLKRDVWYLLFVAFVTVWFIYLERAIV